uniref:Uncharacterized protein n=1 Tax=Candidatus Methanophaga sp. ANME-1 ERB7 TaxID=2759913 RepID=A0A7G9ZCJ4_9EURY|nr:hypothetical protein NNIPPFBB_00023 [Methanosarcinales archaeon ANME-1 ERB7]
MQSKGSIVYLVTFTEYALINLKGNNCNIKRYIF